MTIEIAEGQRFPKQVRQHPARRGGLVLLFSPCACPSRSSAPRRCRCRAARLAAAAAAAAVQVSTRFGGPTRAAWHFPFAEGFAFLALLLFDGETAVFVAASVALCTALRSAPTGKSRASARPSRRSPRSRSSGRCALSSGVLTELTAGLPTTTTTLNAACIAVLVQSLAGSAVYALGVSYRINQSAWRDGAHAFMWQLVGNLAAFASALAAGYGVRFFGTGTAVAVATAACLRRSSCARSSSGPRRACRAGRQRRAREGERERPLPLGLRLRGDRHGARLDRRALASGQPEPVSHTRLRGEGTAAHGLPLHHAPDDLPTALSNIGHLLKGKVQASQMEKRYIHKSGHEVWAHWSVSLVRDHYLKSSLTSSSRFRTSPTASVPRRRSSSSPCTTA